MVKVDSSLEKYPKKMTCGGGLSLTVRPMAEDDFDRVRAFFVGLPSEDRLFLRDDVTRPVVLARWFANLDYATKLPIMALDGDTVVGHALLDADQRGWSPHVAEVRVVVADGYKKRSVGSLLARELFEIAISRGYEKIVARMMESQVAAQKMFERMGFVVEARLSAHVKDLQGERHDLLIMTCKVDDAWARMEDLLQDVAPWAQHH
jgi:L-amino acid N-acyltransferase YncA